MKIIPCDPAGNVSRIISKYRKLARMGVKLAVFPELSVTGLSCGDYFLQKNFIKEAERAAERLCAATADTECVAVAGTPVLYENRLYNAALVIYKGDILGIVPKLRRAAENAPEGHPGEGRRFAAAETEAGPLCFAGRETFFGGNLLFSCRDLPAFCFFVEIGEGALTLFDLPRGGAKEKANIVVNLSSYPELVGKSALRREKLKLISAENHSGYIYSGAPDGESTSFCAYSGHSLIGEGGCVLDESPPFAFRDAISEIDCEKLSFLKRKNPKTSRAAPVFGRSFDMTVAETSLTRKIKPLPFMPEENPEARFREILNIQSRALAKRLEVCGAKMVLNLSGGMDSALAFIVCAEAAKLLNRPFSDIICINSPCFGTTPRTVKNAGALARGMGAEFRTIDITPAVTGHLKDIGHSGEKSGAAFENAQARERTQVAMDIANMENAVMVGTGDMSELALGFTTYNGDHMSMYSVNAGVPKTVIPEILRRFADSCALPGVRDALYDICDTPVSPELVPPENGVITQKTEDIVGPYPVHDFILYHMINHGFSPQKNYRLARAAFGEVYPEDVLAKAFDAFYSRFTAAQFKRACLPDFPRIGTVSLSREGFAIPADIHFPFGKDELKTVFPPGEG